MASLILVGKNQYWMHAIEFIWLMINDLSDNKDSNGKHPLS